MIVISRTITIEETTHPEGRDAKIARVLNAVKPSPKKTMEEVRFPII